MNNITRPLAALLIGALLVATRADAADEKQLQRVKGIVGYQTSDDAAFTAVFGRFNLPDDYVAVTKPNSAALLALPDSSLVALGENTKVHVGAFNNSADGPGATVRVNGGALRFDIRRPPGGAANYRFVTATTQIAVRGTIGLISFVAGNTIVACLVCAADSVAATVGTQTVALASGQFLAVSAAGAVATGTLSGTVLSSFTSAGVSTSSASGSAAATGGATAGSSGAASTAGSSAAGSAGSAGSAGAAGSASAASGAVAGATSAIATGAAVAGVAAAVVTQTHTAASPAPQPTPSAGLSVSGIGRVPAGKR